MGLDRVIQDSDEEEPFEGDAIPTTAGPLESSEPTLEHQHHDIPAEQMTHYAMHKHGPGPDESMFPQMNVNFDEFLQSQERGHALSASQQRLEDKWIPSTSEDGSGSVGAMMAEIGIAQKRLLDDDPSSAGIQLADPAMLYSMDSIQSAPFPTMPGSHGYQIGPSESDIYAFTRVPHGSDANSCLSSARQGIYSLTPPTTTLPVTSPPKAIAQQYFEPLNKQENSLSNPPQNVSQPNLHQVVPYSSHDTEPFSSVAPVGLGGANSGSAGNDVISKHYSQSSTNDELALPAVVPVVDGLAAKKKRGRPKKQPLPENDEDDELANSRDHEFQHSGPNGAIDPSDSEETTENTPASSGLPDETNQGNLELTPKPPKPTSKESKSKKARKTKATPATDTGDDDDVIWVDTKPLDVHPPNNNTVLQTTTPDSTRPDADTTALDSNPPTAPAPAVKENPQAAEPAEKPAPKKRGRKRKQTEEAETPSKATTTPEPNKPVEATTPSSKLAVIVDNSPHSVPDANTSGENDTLDIQNQVQNPRPAQDASPPVAILDELHPQTPSKPGVASVNTPQHVGKGPNKHSPISARSAVPYRVGLSKRARIAPLLKIVRK